jgi:outer membrane biosynthesis protein TonB
MALGGLVVLALLVVAALQLPRFFRTRAGVGAPVSQEPAAQSPAAQPEATQPPTQEAQAPAAAGTEAQSQAEPAPPAATPPPAAAVQQPARPKSQVQRRATASETAAPAQPVETSAQPPAQPQTQPLASPPEQAAAQPEAASGAELEELRDRMNLLAVRANTARGTLQTLEAQQRRVGLGLRGDMAESWKRMEFLLDEAEAAMKKGDSRSTKRNLDLAEREIDKLDKFLGR